MARAERVRRKPASRYLDIARAAAVRSVVHARTTMAKHAPYGRDASVHIETGSDKAAVLDRAIADSGFLEHVEAAFAAGGGPRDGFAIAIKPNLMSPAAADGAAGGDQTDPALVERLIAALRGAGFETIALVESTLAGGPTVAQAAARAGYTSDGYRIADLSEEAVPFVYGGVLGDHVAGAAGSRPTTGSALARARRSGSASSAAAWPTSTGACPSRQARPLPRHRP